jgi:phage-related protein
MFGKVSENVIYLYKTPSNKEIIKEFIENLDDITKARVRNSLRLLKEEGLELLGTQFVKKIFKNPPLFELRVIGKKSIRLMFIKVGNNTFIILHAFVKKSQKTPEKDLKLSIKRAKEFI